MLTLIVLPDGTEVFSGDVRNTAIVSSTITESVNSGTELTLGSTCSSMLECKIILKDKRVLLNAGDEIRLFKVLDNGTRHKVGLFTCEKPTRSGSRMLNLTAYDRVSWLDKDLSSWLNNLTGWPYSLLTFAQMVCQQCGLELVNDSIPNGDYQVRKFKADSITGRQIISWAAEIAGRFARATPDGKIEFAWYTPAKKNISTTNRGETENDIPYFLGSMSKEEYAVQNVEQVQIQFSADDIGTVYPDITGEKNVYKITGNYLLTAHTGTELVPIAKTIYEGLKDITYVPCKVNIPANFDIAAGNTVQITDADGVTVTALIMQRKQAGSRDSLECTGSRNRNSTEAVNNFGFKALEGKYNSIKADVEGIYTEVGNLADDTASKFEQTASQIAAKVSSHGGNQSFSYSLTDSNFTLNSQDTEVFKADKNGISVKGTVKADSGLIGDRWHIEPWGMWAGDDDGYKTIIQDSGDPNLTWMFAAGGTSMDWLKDYRFRVRKDGYTVIEDGCLGKVETGWGIDADNLHNYDQTGNDVRLYTDGVLSNGTFAKWDDIVALAGNSFARLTVNVEEGAVITATRMDVTMVRTSTGDEPNGPGYAIFPIPEAGEWIIRARKGDRKKSTVVTITDAGEYSVGIDLGGLGNKTYTVRIMKGNSNPESACEYRDDAVGMTPGYDGWENASLFKNIRPCILVDGQVFKYLDKNDLTKTADGESININDYSDIMVEIPKIGYRLWSDELYQYVSVTEIQGKEGYSYRAHSLDAEGDCDKIYIGAFLGCERNNILYSVSGETPSTGKTLTEFRSYAQSKGHGYSLLSFYPLTLIQCLFVIKYKNLYSQLVIGQGYVSTDVAYTNTGGTITKGEDYGEQTGKEQMCFLNIEDLWGNRRCWIDGVYVDSKYSIKTDFNNFNDTGVGYSYSKNSGFSSDSDGWISGIQGTNDGGFVIKNTEASSTTYYTDSGIFYANSCCNYGGAGAYESHAGIFYFIAQTPAYVAHTEIGCRLMFKHKGATA